MVRIGVCCLALCLLAGCDSGPALVPVTGTVTLDGKPLSLKSVMFFPQEGTPGHGGGGNTKSDGTYSLIASIPGGLTDEAGTVAGKYKVAVFEPTIPITENLEVQGTDTGEPAPAIAPDLRPRKREIPAIYTTQETTPLVVEVPAEGGVIDLKLTSSGK
jgi:hypothetical protein